MHYLACDLGAESGRLMLGTLADGHLSLEELHRFTFVAVMHYVVCVCGCRTLFVS